MGFKLQLMGSPTLELIFPGRLAYPHFESPQFKQVLQPSIMTTAAVLHFAHSCAPSGKCDFENASVCLVRASNSARFSCTSVRWCSSSSGFLSRPIDCR